MTINPSPKYSGEPSAQALAGGLATLGRYGDNYMVHAAEGETMIPKEVFDENPGLKQDLFRQMTMMGIEDPNRYVIGNELNSINPITGQPEFFFKKVWRAIKRVVKRVAPIVAPIIGNMIAPGIGGIIASGLVTKLQGGSWGDALKVAALSYGASALTSGIGGALQGTSLGNSFGLGAAEAGSTFGGRFATGLGTGLTAPFSAASNLFSSGAQNPLAQGIFGPKGTGTFFSGSVNPASKFAQGDVGLFPKYQSTSALQGQGIDPVTGQYDYLKDPSASGFNPMRAGDTEGIRRVSAQGRDVFVKNPQTGQNMQFTADEAGQLRDVGALTTDGSGSNVLTPDYRAKMSAAVRSAGPATGGTSNTNTFSTQSVDGQNIIVNNRTGQAILGKQAAAAPQKFLGYDFPGSETLAKAAGQAIVPGVIAAGTYLLTPEEKTVEEYLKSNPMDPQRAAYDQWAGIDDKSSGEAQALKNQWYGQSQYSAADLESKFGASPIAGITSPGPTAANAGNLSGSPLRSNLPNIQGGLGNLGVSGMLLNNVGGVRDALMARASGGEVMGPGTGTSDSIPARLSDGEFVMTAQAVRNAGNGNRDVGAARMYDMMNRFERGAA